jgi:hypothetical protein
MGTTMLECEKLFEARREREVRGGRRTFSLDDVLVRTYAEEGIGHLREK